MHYGLVLAGLGTALLGPILPLLARQWGMVDSQSGLLMMAKFCGAFLGGVTVSSKLRRSLLAGMMAGVVGFGGFAVAPSMSVGCVGLFVGGFGLGQIITSVNILAGRRFTAHRGAALSMLNFSFRLGAMLSALLAAWLLPRVALRGLLEGFAMLFAVGVVGLIAQMRGTREVPVVFGAALGMAHSAVTIAGFAVLLGLSLAPFFPATWALLMAERPTARQAGIVLAVSGLGAAALPWLMGVVSTGAGSLQVALVLPFAAALGLLGMSWLAPG